VLLILFALGLVHTLHHMHEVPAIWTIKRFVAAQAILWTYLTNLAYAWTDTGASFTPGRSMCRISGPWPLKSSFISFGRW